MQQVIFQANTGLQLAYHIQFTKVASDFPNEIADFSIKRRKVTRSYLFQIQFLIKQNQNVGLYHVS